MTDIQSLTQTVHDFSQSVDLWNQLMLWGLGFTVVATLFVLVATRMVVFRAGQLSTAQEALGEAKDRQLESDLKGKDIKIAEALKAGGEANERAANLEAQNLKLEAVVQPRDLSQEQLKDMADRFKSFAGRELSVRSYALDLESKRFGMIIEDSLKRAGLHIADNLGTVMNLKGKIVEGIEVRGPEHVQDDLIEAILGSRLGKDKRLKVVRNPKPGFTGYFGDEVFAENPGVCSGARVEIFIGLKPTPDLK